ncbi:MAG: YjgP/YjgQ family permease [Verrucomicrobia bacterium]|nr:YjgP/YjgQ family permease [Verrucomicrobiota bacterium]
MIKKISDHPFTIKLTKLAVSLAERVKTWNLKSLWLQLSLVAITTIMIVIAIESWQNYNDLHTEFQELLAKGKANPNFGPPIGSAVAQTLGVFVVGIGLFISVYSLRKRLSSIRRARATQLVLWIAAIGVLVAWLPTDYTANFADVMVSRIGENPSVAAYLGKLVLIGLLILSFPLMARLHFRSSIMDQYVVRTFLTPFAFTLIGFVAIWLIFDLTDNGPDFAEAKASFNTIIKFYFIQLPQVILFVLPVTLLLSLLYSLSRMSASNELISMLGAGRSMMRVLRPLFIIGLYSSLICLVFKYQWAPRSEGAKVALLQAIHDGEFTEEKRGKKKKRQSTRWAKFGWMYVNQVDRRTWFVGRVPLDFTKKNMGSVAIWQFDENQNLLTSWRGKSAFWFFGNRTWKLYNGKTYTYGPDGIPRVQSWETLELPGWRETPWKVISASMNPEHLGIPGLTTYLRTNADYDDKQLAPYRTNWWYCWAEPLSCLVMVLVSAPLGIVYSRRGVLGGVAASIFIFAAMYFLRGTFLAFGQNGQLPPFVAAWATNFIFAGIGAMLLYYRSQNRQPPDIKSVLNGSYFRKLFNMTST